MAGAAITVPTIFTAKDKTTRIVKTMTKSVKGFVRTSAAGIRRLNTRLNNTVKKIGKVGALAGGLALGTLFSTAIQGNLAFNDSLASVSAITGNTGKDLEKLEQLAMKSAKSQKLAGSEVLKAYELVGSAQPILLKNTELLDEVTNAAITLSKAGRMDLAEAATSLTTTMNQFGLSGEKAGTVINNLAAGATAGSSTITQTSEAIAKFGTAAAAMGVKVDEAVSLVQLASPFERGAEAGTKLRNILGKISGAKILPPKAQAILKKTGVDTDLLADKNVSLQEKLIEVKKVLKDANGAALVFGEQNKALAIGVLNNAENFQAMRDSVNLSGEATRQAEVNSASFNERLKAIKASFINATTATNSNNKAMQMMGAAMDFVANNMETIVAVAGIMLGAFLALKVVTGIMTAITVATKLWSAAQIALNFIMNMNPIGLIIIGIAALVALIALIINKYDEWGASLTFLLGPFGMIINIIQSFRRNWDMVKKAFSEGGLLEGLKAIGRVLLDAILMPVQQLLSLLAKIPGLGGLAGKGADMIGELRASLGVDTGEESAEANGEGVLPSTTQASSSEVIKRTETRNSLDINIKDRGNNVDSVVQKGPEDIPVNTTSTLGI